MQKDPRFRNTFFKTTTVKDYLKEYAGAISYALNKIDADELNKAKDSIRVARRIFVGGNGGSSSISDHLVCDFVKGCHQDEHHLDVHSLNGSTALFTAIGNDFGYEHTLSFQLEQKDLSIEDLVILISSSGNSPNIVKASEVTLKKGATLIGMTGFSGGKLFEMADIKLHVPFNNYGIVEDCHQALMHALAQYHWLALNEK